MLKMIGICMVFMGCSLAGIAIDLKYRKRVKELEELVYALECLKGEITYRLSPLQEACDTIGKQVHHGVGALFINFSKLLKQKEVDNLYVLWKQALKQEAHHFHFNNEDYEMLYEFGRGLGYLDKNMQQANIELFLNRLNNTLEKALKEQEKSSKLRTGMGILIGACMSILII